MADVIRMGIKLPGLRSTGAVAWLRLWRSSGLTQSAFAARHGISTRTLQARISGEVSTKALDEYLEAEATEAAIARNRAA